jgi:hypothetical protein
VEAVVAAVAVGTEAVPACRDCKRALKNPPSSRQARPATVGIGPRLPGRLFAIVA